MGLLDRVRAEASGVRDTSIDGWISDYLIPAVNTFSYGGSNYISNSLGLNHAVDNTTRLMRVSNTLPGYMTALKASAPAFAAQLVRAQVLSQARFAFRNPPYDRNNPRKLFGNGALSLLERPWANGTSSDLIELMEWHSGIAGSAVVVRRPDRLRVLRPDYVAAVYGSDLDPEDPEHALDGELLGYIYQRGGVGVGPGKPQLLDVKDVAVWSPIPDPENPGCGMSWLTPAIREIQLDRAVTDFKAKFFANGATPNLVVKGIPATTPTQFDDWVSAIEKNHTGAANAFKTLYLSGVADATIVGSNLKDLDLESLQGWPETRIAMLSRVPATVLGIMSGLKGSSLNAGNFGQTRRLFADTWVFPQLQSMCAALGTIIDVPTPAELWTDTSDMPLLREDGKDAAEIDQVKATAIKTLIDSGMEPKTAISTIAPEWAGSLTHTGLVSVQLQEPGAVNNPAAPAAAPKTEPTPAPTTKGDS
jgi:phage portal protein BeeE